MLNMWKNLSKSLRKKCVNICEAVHNFPAIYADVCKNAVSHNIFHQLFNMISTITFKDSNLFRRVFFTVST